MKVEIVIQCIDDGRVPKHQIFTFDIKGNESRDVRMRKLGKNIIQMMKREYPKPTTTNNVNKETINER